MHSAKRFLFPAVLLLAAACGKEAGPDTAVPDSIRDRRIPAAQVPLYGNLASYNLLPGSAGTRTDGKSVTLGSLLDTKQARTLRFGDVSFIQIPFLPDGEPVLAAYGSDLAPDIGSATPIRKFYVESLQDGIPYRFIAVMVAEAQYIANHPGFDYLDMPNFTGAVLLATPEGGVFRVENYQSGLVRESVLLQKEEIAGKSGLHYLKLYRQATDTRTGGNPDGWELETAVCLAEKPETDPAGKSALLISHPQYTVSITTNLPDYVDVKGCGTYSSGSWATLGCFPRHTFITMDFGRWTGSFARPLRGPGTGGREPAQADVRRRHRQRELCQRHLQGPPGVLRGRDAPVSLGHRPVREGGDAGLFHVFGVRNPNRDRASGLL